MGQYGNAWEEQLRLQADSDSTASTDSNHLLRPAYMKDKHGVWRCGNCLDEDERDFGAFHLWANQCLELFQENFMV